MQAEWYPPVQPRINSNNTPLGSSKLVTFITLYVKIYMVMSSVIVTVLPGNQQAVVWCALKWKLDYFLQKWRCGWFKGPEADCGKHNKTQKVCAFISKYCIHWFKSKTQPIGLHCSWQHPVWWGLCGKLMHEES